MHVLVQAFHDVGKRLNEVHLRLFPVPLGKGVGRAQISRIGDAAFTPRVQRVLEHVQPGQVFDDEVGIVAETVALIEVAGPVVAQLDARNSGNQNHCHNGDHHQQNLAPFHHECAEAVEEAGTLGWCRWRVQRQNGKHGRQERHRVDENANQAKGHHIA